MLSPRGGGAASEDLENPHRRQILTMASLAPVILPPLLFEDDDLWTTGLLHDFR